MNLLIAVLFLISAAKLILNSLLQFCQRWNLKVNVAKTKVIVFNKSGKLLKGSSFTYDGQTVEIVSDNHF